MSACGEISAGIALDCKARLVAGTMENIILMNYDKFKALNDTQLVFDALNNLVVSDINFTGSDPGTYAWQFTGKKNSNAPLVEAQRGTYDLYYKHTLGFKVFANDPNAKAIIDSMSDSLVVAIVQNKNTTSDSTDGTVTPTDGNSAYEIYGADSGLQLATSTRNPNDAETKGAWDLVLSNDDNELEGHVPLTIWDGTSYATTKTMVDALLDPVV